MRKENGDNDSQMMSCTYSKDAKDLQKVIKQWARRVLFSFIRALSI